MSAPSGVSPTTTKSAGGLDKSTTGTRAAVDVCNDGHRQAVGTDAKGSEGADTGPPASSSVFTNVGLLCKIAKNMQERDGFMNLLMVAGPKHVETIRKQYLHNTDVLKRADDVLLLVESDRTGG